MGLNENACEVLSAVLACSECSISSCIYAMELGEGRLERAGWFLVDWPVKDSGGVKAVSNMIADSRKP